MKYDPGFGIFATRDPLGFKWGNDCFGPEIEMRRLDSIRPSLRNPNCDGPDPVYAIAMDVGKSKHHVDLIARHLLFGAVAYGVGRLGDEPVRSQGHVHKASPLNGWSTPEVYEIWDGLAVIFMQESDTDDPGRCFAVEAGPGDVVIVPPAWAHATISANPNQGLVFGAWCDRAYGFDYDGVRAHGGLAWFPQINREGLLDWIENPAYAKQPLTIKSPRQYAEFGFESNTPIYQQYERHPERFMFVPEPGRVASLWEQFIP